MSKSEAGAEPANEEYDRFKKLTQQLLDVPKSELDAKLKNGKTPAKRRRKAAK